MTEEEEEPTANTNQGIKHKRQPSRELESIRALNNLLREETMQEMADSTITRHESIHDDKRTHGNFDLQIETHLTQKPTQNTNPNHCCLLM